MAVGLISALPLVSRDPAESFIWVCRSGGSGRRVSLAKVVRPKWAPSGICQLRHAGPSQGRSCLLRQLAVGGSHSVPSGSTALDAPARRAASIVGDHRVRPDRRSWRRCAMSSAECPAGLQSGDAGKPPSSPDPPTLIGAPVIRRTVDVGVLSPASSGNRPSHAFHRQGRGKPPSSPPEIADSARGRTLSSNFSPAVKHRAHGFVEALRC